MISKPRSAALVLFFILAIVLAACGGGNRFTELRYDQPSRYYLHVPDGYVEYQQWPLFIALHGIKQNSQDCITEWFEIADENQFFLLCPELESDGEGLDRPVNERILANILSKLYRDYSLRERFFLAGKGEAASFALHYAFRYPQAVDGVSAIDASSYPSSVSSGDFPILVIVESEDEEAIEAAGMFMKSLDESGTQTRLLEIENIGSEIPYSVQRLTVELFEQVSQ